jgi:hypothetical protein
MAYNMKNSALKMSAKTGSPMQGNYASPMKQWWNPLNKEVKSERVDEKSYGSDGESTEKKSRTYQNKFTGNRKVKTKETTKSGGPGDFGGSRTDTKKTTTKQEQYGKKDDFGYDTREYKNRKQAVKTKTKIKGAAIGDFTWKDKTTTTDPSKMDKNK